MIAQELEMLIYKAQLYDEVQSIELERLRSNERFKECIKSFHNGFESIGVGKDYNPKPKKLKVIKTKRKKEDIKYPENGLVRLRKFNPEENKKIKAINNKKAKKKNRNIDFNSIRNLLA